MKRFRDLRPWAVLFLAVSVVAAVFGFFVIVGIAALIARTLFLVFLVLFAYFLVHHYIHGHHR